MIILAILEQSFAQAISVAHSILQDRQLAEDAVTETVVRCLNKGWQCRDQTARGFRNWFFTCLRHHCLEMLRGMQGRGPNPRVMLSFDEQIESPEWEAQHAACSPADQIGDREEYEEKQRVLALLITLLPDNYRGAILERFEYWECGHPSSFQFDAVVFFRAKQAVVRLGLAYQKAADVLAECPHRLLPGQLQELNLRKLQRWLAGLGPPPIAGSPLHPLASAPQWSAFGGCIQAFKPAHRVPILIDLIPAFRSINR